jgi:hypothetical protein
MTIRAALMIGALCAVLGLPGGTVLAQSAAAEDAAIEADEAAEAAALAAEAAKEEAVLADEVEAMEKAEKAKAAEERGHKAFMDSKK